MEKQPLRSSCPFAWALHQGGVSFQSGTPKYKAGGGDYHIVAAERQEAYFFFLSPFSSLSPSFLRARLAGDGSVLLILKTVSFKHQFSPGKLLLYSDPHGPVIVT